ncbi:hypothetical protein B7G68_14760 [Caulobacter segnis]|uniref:Uncharacterized protein n=2 Tax=Caulobacter segnis TaxID=88688 RepID=D5VLF6_CAUST|nr:hypothetical protein [Caulobacter segnis]ADG11329.1 conserved hypothetical protein [Caulobacter segnis ATCC 21756]AVQ02997.1 hypothetical protein B7G68_14760 [Caulobacter segnis]
MSLTSKLTKIPTRTRRVLISLSVGAPLGYAVGWSIANFEKAGVFVVPKLGWSDSLALFLAALMLLIGLVTLAVSTSRRMLGQQINPDEQRPATGAQASFYAQSGAVLALAGVMFATPVLVPARLDPVPTVIASAAMIALVALFLLQTALNLSIWARADELLRRALGEVAAVSFFILQGALFLWAAAEKLGLVAPLTLWDAVSVMMAVYLLVNSLISWRRGLAV